MMRGGSSDDGNGHGTKQGILLLQDTHRQRSKRTQFLGQDGNTKFLMENT
jgi:hypothetical protein